MFHQLISIASGNDLDGVSPSIIDKLIIRTSAVGLLLVSAEQKKVFPAEPAVGGAGSSFFFHT